MSLVEHMLRVDHDYLAIRLWAASPSGKTSIYQVVARSTDDLLGVIRWYGPWRCYVFYPAPDTLFNYGCLSTIAGWCDTTTRAHRSPVASGTEGEDG